MADTHHSILQMSNTFILNNKKQNYYFQDSEYIGKEILINWPTFANWHKSNPAATADERWGAEGLSQG